jgi:hypothetical protein
MSKKTYYVADGVSAISAARIPASRKLRLTEGEAMHDVSLGRLLTTKPKAAAGSAESVEGEE